MAIFCGATLKTRNIFLVFPFAILLALTGCTGGQYYQTKQQAPASSNPGDSLGGDGGGSEEPPKVEFVVSNYPLVIQEGPAANMDNEVTFVIDDSLSMLDEINRLKVSLPTFFNQLAAKQIPFNARFVTMGQVKSYPSRTVKPKNLEPGAAGFITGTWTNNLAPLYQPQFLALSYNNLLNSGNPANLSQITTFLNSLQASNIDDEMGILIAADRIRALPIYATVPQKATNLHVVVLSDEDNSSRIDGNNSPGLSAGRMYDVVLDATPNFSYQIKYTGKRHDFNYSTACLITDNPMNARAGVSNERYSCGSDDGVIADYFSSSDQQDKFSCKTPSKFLCPVVIDGETIQVSRTTYSAGCTVDPTAVMNSVIISAGSVGNSLYSDCHELSCVLNWSERYRQDSTNNMYRYFRDNCPAGYSNANRTAAAKFSLDEYQIALWDGVLPTGMTHTMADIGASPVLTFEDARTDDQLVAYAVSNFKVLAQNVQILARSPQTGDPQAIPATPDGLLSVVAQAKGAAGFYWHSIVNLDGKNCDPKIQSDVAKGAQYMSLSAKTSGTVADICQTDYSNLITKLAEAIAKPIIQEYDLTALPNWDANSPLTAKIEVKNAAGDLLVEGVNYTLQGYKIRFSGVKANDMFSVTVTYPK